MRATGGKAFQCCGVRIDALSTDAAVARLLDGPRVTVHLCN